MPQEKMQNEKLEKRLERQISFLIEIDKMKSIIRNNYLADGSRKENDAEHSWHLSMMVILLSEYMASDAELEGKGEFDVTRTLKMVLVHDLVEVYAGDVYCYDEKANEGKLEREKAAAEKLFGILPSDQKDNFTELWMEFEEKATKEAKFAAMVDRMQPLLLNYHSKGKSWQEHNISGFKVLERNSIFDEGPEVLRDFVHSMIKDAVDKGYLLK